jgi:hypothetical protein
MNKLKIISMDCNLDRRALLKFATGASAFALAPHSLGSSIRQYRQ